MNKSINQLYIRYLINWDDYFMFGYKRVLWNKYWGKLLKEERILYNLIVYPETYNA